MPSADNELDKPMDRTEITNLLDAAERGGLGLTALRTLAALAECTEPNGESIPQYVIPDITVVPRGSVTRALAALVRAGYAEGTGMEGRSPLWRLARRHFYYEKNERNAQ